MTNTPLQFRYRLGLLSCTLACLQLVLPAVARVSLVEDGQPQIVIVLPQEPLPQERLAAEELVEHLTLISGAAPSVATVNDERNGKRPLYLGQAADPALDEDAMAAGNNPSTFVLRVTDERIDIRGLSDEGTLFGAYELLEQLGVRWYLPGELGRVVPRMAEPRVAIQQTAQAPSMELRVLSGWLARDLPWYRRQRLGGAMRSTGSHGIQPFRRNQSLFRDNPALYALRGGERRLGQICASNPEAPLLTAAWIRERHEPTEEKFYIGMGPDDGEGYCECVECAKRDGDVFDPFYGTTSVTGRYIWFFNQLLDELEDDYPNLHIAWYVYARHMMPPPVELPPNPRIVHVFAPITLDRIRGMDNPMSPDRHVLRWVVDAWSRLEPNEMAYRGYYNNLACPQFPFSQVDRIRHETPAFLEKDIHAMRVEVIRQGWANNAVSLYLAGRMMWDVDTDVDALLDEFYQKFYGPAAEPMGRYWDGLDAAFRDTPYLAGSSYPYFAIFDITRRSEMRQHLAAASTLTAELDDDPPYAERVRIAVLGFSRMDLFLDMIAARNQHDYNLADQKRCAFEQLNDKMADYVLEGEELRDQRRRSALINYMERSDTRGNYFNRFFKSAIVAGHHRTVEAGELVAGLPDVWDFLIDPAQVGEIAGYYRPGQLGGNWQPLKTNSRTWSDQGLHYYKGDAWYRTHVVIPEKYEGRPVYLWFGGIDNAAKVWVNGQLLGTNREPLHGLPGEAGTFRPFDMLATEAIRFGEKNTVSVKITNDRLAELGTGGIVAPVMFWSPHDPAWQPGG